MSDGELKRRSARRGGVAVAACLAVGLAGVAWSGCGGSSDETKSVEQRFEKGIEKAKEGLEKGAEEAKKGLKNSGAEARKSLEKAKEEAKKGIEEGREEAKKGVEEAEKYKEEYAP